MGQVERFETVEQYLEYLAERRDESLAELRNEYYGRNSERDT
jgi:hypothetical protein